LWLATTDKAELAFAKLLFSPRRGDVGAVFIFVLTVVPSNKLKLFLYFYLNININNYHIILPIKYFLLKIFLYDNIFLFSDIDWAVNKFITDPYKGSKLD
jgi:hypothetical protein